MTAKTRIDRQIDHDNLIRELAQNKVDAREIIREALSNGKDHHANTVWIRTVQVKDRDHRLRVDVFLMNDGEGMNNEQFGAFWGISRSIKPNGNRDSIGYKGHGTKLFFAADQLSVATRAENESGWRYTSLKNPGQWQNQQQIEVHELPPDSELANELKRVGQFDKHGIAIHIQGCKFDDAEQHLLKRRGIESYCDWFTVIGDIRSGVFASRREFHEHILNPQRDTSLLREHEAPLRPITVYLMVNGEKDYVPLGLKSGKDEDRLLAPWSADQEWLKKEKKSI